MTKLKLFLCIAFLAGVVFSAEAQDLITLRTGEIIEGIVTEISPTEIRYRRFEQQAGPIVVLPANTVFMILYQDGTREVITPLDAAVPAAGQPAQAQVQPPAQNWLYMDEYRAYRAMNNRWLAFGLNLVVGFGVGSFVQGDTIGGVIGLTTEAASFGILIYGILNPRIEEHEFNLGWPTYLSYTETTASISRLVWVGIAGMTASRVFQLYRPFSYARRMNIAFVPALDHNGNPALAANFSFKFD
jgi:hypothetical protein